MTLRRLSLLAALCTFSTLLSAQQPALEVGRSGDDIVLRFWSEPNSYYILRTGTELDSVDTPVGMKLGAGVIDTLIDAGVLAAPLDQEFYRLEKIPRSEPNDTDQDGIHDVLELEHGFLDPLEPADAEEDQDNDGFTNRLELVTHRTSPLVANQGILPPQILGLSFQAAKETLEAAGFRVGTITCQLSVHRPATAVLAPDLAPSVALPQNAEIDLTISLPLDPNLFIDQRNLVPFDGTEENALAYYDAVDPNGDRTTLEDWKAANNFGQPGGEEVFAAYFNEADLGFGRRMFMRRDAERVAYWVVNYATADEAAQGLQTDIATVAMEYSPHPIKGGAPYVKFFTFNGNHPDPTKRGDPNFGPDVRLTKIDLDGRGQKFQPGMCITCHGGTPQELIDGVYPDLGRTGARFIPFDVDSFTYPTLPGFSRADQEAAFKKLNEGVLASIPAADRFSFKGLGANLDPAEIPNDDPAGVDIPLLVSGLPGTIADLDFSFDGKGPCSIGFDDFNNGVTHFFVSDLVVTLTSPAGTSVTLIDRIGLPDQHPVDGTVGRNFCHTRLDDEATAPIENANREQAPFAGSWIPNNPLAAFDGEDPNGTWVLNVSDHESGGAGVRKVNQWSLHVTPSIQTDAVVDLIHGWYGGPTLPDPFDENFIPADLLTPEALAEGSDTLYREVLAKSCRACHVMLTARRPDLDFDSHDELAPRRESFRSLVFELGRMPMAKRTFDKFWKSAGPSQAEILAAWIDDPNRFSYTGPSASIPDSGEGAPLELQLTVAGMTGPIGDLDFSFDGAGPCSRTAGDLNNGLTHPAVDELVATLISPQGTSVTILDRVGGNGSNFCAFRLDDESQVSLAGVTASQAPYPGSWRPGSPLSAFDGEDPNGTWTLRLEDRVAQNTGSVQQWSLHFDSLGATSGPGTARAVITAPLTALFQETVILDASSSLFASTYEWSLDSVPAGSLAALTTPDAEVASFVVDQPGTYAVTLTARNPFGEHAVSRDITVANQFPQVSAASNSPVLYPVTLHLSGQGSDDGLPITPGTLTYLWEKASGPGSVTFADPLQQNTTATVSTPGSYVLCFSAFDGELNSSAMITVEADPAMVTIGDPGNPAHGVLGYGAVGYLYQIGEFEVTNLQYTEFLNAVATESDPYELYHPDMDTHLSGGITKEGDPGSFTYTAKPGQEMRPVNFVEFFDAVRYVNWLNNGATTGASTETGAYHLLGGTPLPSNAGTVTREPDAAYWIPSIDEWFKAAYHEPRVTGGSIYWGHATQSHSQPGATPPPGVPTWNAANYLNGANGLTPVGAYYDSPSYYGTFDQTGNVWEVMDTITDLGVLGPGRGGGGGGAFSSGASISSATVGSWGLDWRDAMYGFRIAGSLTGSGVNQAPDVSAGENASVSPIGLPASLVLSGSATDDGRPEPATLTTQWTQINGPPGAPPVTFTDDTDPASTVSFPRHGTYVLRLTADDGELPVFDQVTISVLVSFERDIVPLLTSPAATCLDCHNDNFASGGLSLGTNFSTPKSCNSIFSQLMPGPGSGRVNTSNPQLSKLLVYPATGGGSMSAVSGFGAGSENYRKILLWIQQGAQNDCAP